MNRNPAGIVAGRRPHRRMIAQQGQGAVDLVSEVRGVKRAGLRCIPARGFCKLLASRRLEYRLHLRCVAISASISAKTCSAGIHWVRP
ncbi:MAG TPA: hypothetical protein PKI28_13950, partial [Accumulibacter sp.]|nr:hypothetical protein [Accumulibacter sp.]